MRLNQTIRRTSSSLLRRAYASLPTQGVERPVFIVGCGRSGTTILGTSLSKHRHVTYLNEPRHLWFMAYPETDIWTPQAESRNGRLVLTAADAHPGKTKKLSRLFRFEARRSGRPVLIEKLPINNFRLELIHHVFPDARFVHIYRNGLEVARSIAKLSDGGRWFGADAYKWERLAEYARHDSTVESDLPDRCTTHFEKGLLEWRLSTEAVVRFLKRLPPADYVELDYARLVDEPVPTMDRILDFLSLDRDPNVLQFVSERLTRRTSTINFADASEKERWIGGPILPLSTGTTTGLTPSEG